MNAPTKQEVERYVENLKTYYDKRKEDKDEKR